MKIDIKLEYHDYLKFNLWCIFRRKVMKIWLFVTILVFLVYSIYVPRISFWPVLWLIIFIVMWLLSIFLSTMSVFKANRALSELVYYEFTESAIEMNCKSSSEKNTWESIYEIVETRNSFLIFISKAQAYILPKRYFVTREKIAGFRQLLRNYGSKEETKLKKAVQG